MVVRLEADERGGLPPGADLGTIGRELDCQLGKATTMRFSRFALPAVFLAIAVFAGCKKPAATSVTVQPVPEARDEGGWPVYEVKTGGFAISLPPSWRQIEMDPATFDAKFKEVAKLNPELESMRENLKSQVLAGLKFFAFDPASSTTGFATNINIVRLPLPPGASLDSIVSEIVRLLETLPGFVKPLDHERLQSPSGERDRFRYKRSMAVPGRGTLTLALTQFALAHGSEYVVVTMTTLGERDHEYASDFDKIGRSFRFTK
jgi:hypothetical protein